MKPRVSRNQATVSSNFGVIITPWAIRFTCEGPLGSRISSPARDSGSSPVLSFWRLAAIAGTGAMPCTTSIWYPFGSVSRTRLPPPGSSIASTADAPGALARRARSSSLSA